MFGWLKTRVKNSVLAGVAEAVQELTQGEQPDEAPVIAQLRLTLAPAPAAVETDAAPARRRKASE